MKFFPRAFYLCREGLRHWRLFFGRNHQSTVELVLFPRRNARLGYRLCVDYTDDHAIDINLHLPLLGSLYIGLGGRFARALGRRVSSGQNECLLSARWGRSDDSCGLNLAVSAWARVNEWRSADPWWRKSRTIYFADLFLGYMAMSERDLVTVERTVLIPAYGDYPERNHRVTVAVKHCSWGRPRSPFAPYRAVCTDTRLHEMAPFPGKGTCDYNCGEDGLNASWRCHKIVDPDLALLGDRTALDTAIALACRDVVDTVMARRRDPYGD